jgi:hypothetical protein
MTVATTVAISAAGVWPSIFVDDFTTVIDTSDWKLSLRSLQDGEIENRRWCRDIAFSVLGRVGHSKMGRLEYD